MREGKTAKDTAKGTQQRNAANKQERAAWQHECQGHGNHRSIPFPKTTCNGKKNHHRYTGKNNTTVVN